MPKTYFAPRRLPVPNVRARARRAARIRLAAPRFAKIPQPDGRADRLAPRVLRALARASRPGM